MIEVYSPKTVIEYQELVHKLTKKYGDSFSDDHGIIVTHHFISDICSLVIDLQNRIAELESNSD
jgi:hypothetical protein